MHPLSVGGLPCLGCSRGHSFVRRPCRTLVHCLSFSHSTLVLPHCPCCTLIVVRVRPGLGSVVDLSGPWLSTRFGSSRLVEPLSSRVVQLPALCWLVLTCWPVSDSPGLISGRPGLSTVQDSSRPVLDLSLSCCLSKACLGLSWTRPWLVALPGTRPGAWACPWAVTGWSPCLGLAWACSGPVLGPSPSCRLSKTRLSPSWACHRLVALSRTCLGLSWTRPWLVELSQTCLCPFWARHWLVNCWGLAWACPWPVTGWSH